MKKWHRKYRKVCKHNILEATMTIDLSVLTIEQLNDVISEAQRLIKSKKKSQLKAARAQIEKVAADFGYTLEELMVGKNIEQEESSPKVRKPVEIRYRNPVNQTETWTGRGKQPRWLAAAIASGKSLQDFAI